MTAAPPRLMTADEFFCLPDDGKRYELVEGRLEDVGGGSPRSSAVAANILILLGSHVRPHKLGGAGGADRGAKRFADPDTVRVPDVCFVRGERLPGGRVPVRFQDGAPDLVVAVLSA
jgi:Uma2 family endonuclease